jgi:hypothetical protein
LRRHCGCRDLKPQGASTSRPEVCTSADFLNALRVRGPRVWKDRKGDLAYTYSHPSRRLCPQSEPKIIRAEDVRNPAISFMVQPMDILRERFPGTISMYRKRKKSRSPLPISQSARCEHQRITPSPQTPPIATSLRIKSAKHFVKPRSSTISPNANV